MTRAVVFAYHNVGYQCLAVLLAHKIDVPLVITHEDDPNEQIWFDSVARLAQQHHIASIVPDDANASDIVERVRTLQPDFLFSFYYRKMLKAPLLDLPQRGALNMHGSLLPQYRGRAPVNWAVINGATQTGATLHYMTLKPDAGDIVDQEAVPIAIDDTAFDVFNKVTRAARVVLDRSLPGLVAGSAPRRPQRLEDGRYFGGRTPEDGRIDWNRSALQIHNLVRGVAPPYPGAFTTMKDKTLRILRTQLQVGRSAGAPRTLYMQGAECFVTCADGQTLQLITFDIDGTPATAADIHAQFGESPISL